MIVLDLLKAIKSRSEKLSLKQKFSITIFLGITIPTISIAMLLINNLNYSEIQKIKQISEQDLLNINGKISDNIQLADISIQIVKTNRAITEFLSRTDEISAKEIFDFNRIYSTNIENIFISNPNFNGIRIYYDNEQIPEMWPVFYNTRRISGQEWFNQLNSKTTYIRYRYDDNFIKYSGYVPSLDLISFNTKIDTKQNRTALIEVSFKTKDFFIDMKNNDENSIMYFINNGDIYCNNTSNSFFVWKDILPKINSNLDFDKMEYTEEKITIDGEKYLVNFKKTEFLDGYLVNIISLTKSLSYLRYTQTILLGGIFISVIVLCLVINRVISVLLERMYKVVSAMKELERGNLEIEVNNTGDDELSQLEGFFNKMARQINNLIEQNMKRAITEKDAEIRALQNQINSHFLYNTLESIKMLSEVEKQYQISDAITALAKLLRYSMTWTSQTVKIGEEIKYIENYLKILNLRYDYVITLATDLSDEFLLMEIPKMTIQPIIENAVIHGIDILAVDATIYIKMVLFNEDVAIEITDNGVGINEKQLKLLNQRISGEIKPSTNHTSGIGLRNVQERLILLFGEKYGLKVMSEDGKYTKVRILIPFKRGDE